MKHQERSVANNGSCRHAGEWLLIGLILLTVSAIHGSARAVAAAESWQAGVARQVITPEQPMWMSGYGGRDHEAEGAIHDLWAKAVALRDPAGKIAVFISTDLIGVPIKMARVVSAAVKEKHGLDRSQLMFTSSHTHCGPALDMKLTYMHAMDDGDWAKVRAYQEKLNKQIVVLIDRAIADLKPAQLESGIGNCAFASNRRTPKGLGPYDHDVPVLKISSPDGEDLRAVVFGYACHNTTLSFYNWCGDYAGFAQIDIEDRHPGTTALFFSGCGADQNPLPRRKVELAQKYGRMLSISVEKVLESNLQPLAGPLQTSFREIELEFDPLPDKAALLEQKKNSSRYTRQRAELLLAELEENGQLSPTYDYPIQVWQIGEQFNWVALGGEVVADYSIRIKKELGEGQTWVTGYASDVMAYIPSERVLEEGGYEGESSMIVYQLPSKWKAGLEAQILEAVHDLAGN